MNVLFSLYALLLGLVLGSFYNVVALRVPLKESVVHPPSRCPHCGQRLRGRDLIPVLSYLLSRAKCRYCGARVSLLYPLGEAATAMLFLAVYLRTGFNWETVAGLLLASLCVIVSIADLKTMLIPNRILLAFLPLLIAIRLIQSPQPLWHHLLGAGVGGGVLFLVAVLSKGGMGMGDVKLFTLCGWVIGYPNTLVAFLLACLLGTLVGGVLRVTGRIKKRQPVPFAPFLAAGALLAYGFGTEIIHTYLNLIV